LVPETILIFEQPLRIIKVFYSFYKVSLTSEVTENIGNLFMETSITEKYFFRFKNTLFEAGVRLEGERGQSLKKLPTLIFGGLCQSLSVICS